MCVGDNILFNAEKDAVTYVNDSIRDACWYLNNVAEKVNAALDAA